MHCSSAGPLPVQHAFVRSLVRAYVFWYTCVVLRSYVRGPWSLARVESGSRKRADACCRRASEMRRLTETREVFVHVARSEGSLLTVDC